MKLYYSFLCLTAILCGSCGKDENDAPFVLEGEYQSAPTVVASNPIVLYTRNGQIDKPEVIDKFLRRNSWISVSFSRANVALPTDESFHLTIRANNGAALISQYQTYSDTIEAEVTDKTADYVVLANRDSTGFLVSPASSRNACVQLADKIKAVYPGRRCVPVSIAAGTYENACKIRPVRVIGIKNRQLFIPQLNWVITHSDQLFTCGQAQADEWNILNPAVTGQLGVGDTLVAQERRITLLKQ